MRLESTHVCWESRSSVQQQTRCLGHIGKYSYVKNMRWFSVSVIDSCRFHARAKAYGFFEEKNGTI